MRPILLLVTGVPGTGKSTVAELASAELGGAAVLAHDWAMSGLRPYPGIEAALDAMGWTGRRLVGWSLLLALARAQLRSGRHVVLDGVAREPEVASCAAVASEEAARFVLVSTTCPDEDLHRSRVEGRRRDIPGWYELSWDHVLRARAGWHDPAAADLVLSAAEPLHDHAARLATLLGPA